MILFDVQQRTILAELSTPHIKYVVWNSDMSQVALLCKHAIVIADKKLQNAQTIHETIRVKVRQREGIAFRFGRRREERIDAAGEGRLRSLASAAMEDQDSLVICPFCVSHPLPLPLPPSPLSRHS